MTTKEAIYRILTLLKQNSDDSSDNFSEEFIYNMLIEKRALILKQQFKDARKDIPLAMYQQICIPLETQRELQCDDRILVSKNKIPSLLSFSGEYGTFKFILRTKDQLSIPHNFVDFERLPYVGNNKWLKTQVYIAINQNGKLYFKSNSPVHLKMKEIIGFGVFLNPEDAYNSQCEESTICDFFDSEFPMDLASFDFVLKMIYEELGYSRGWLKDKTNNSDEGNNMPRQSGGTTGQTSEN